MPKKIDLTGNRYGRLKVIKTSGSIGGKTYWECECECGVKKRVRTAVLTQGFAKSCGCLQKEIVRNVMTTHGMKHTKEYKVWEGMLYRVRSNNKNYGGRGITVSKDWEKFENFIQDMGICPAGLSIDRIDNNKGYCKENCRWATNKDQSNNRRSNSFITYNGKTQNIKQWSEETGIGRTLIHYRIKKGYPVELLFSSLTRKSLKFRML
jgi:hypothetical protein